MLGRLLIALAIALAFPTLVAFAQEGPDLASLVVSLVLVGAAGLGLQRGFKQEAGFTFGRNEAFLLVTLAWFSASLVAALPWILFKGPMFTVDALFEGASGFTTTGASILTDIEAEPDGLLFWRSQTQWMGGMGIIVLGIAILPRLSVGGINLLSAEAPGPIQEKLTPRIARTAKALWGIYALLTGLEFLILLAIGLSPLDAINHAFTTLATGGFSTKNASIAGFDSALVEMVITLFMFLAGINFAIYFHLLRGRPKPFLEDPEVRLYAGIAAAATLLITLDLFTDQGDFLGSLRVAVFQVVALQTGTGYASADFDSWPGFSMGLLFVLFFVGGCAGSTTGSVKVVRIQIVLKKVLADLRQMIQPHAVIPVRQGERVIPPDVATSVVTFLILFLLLFVMGGLALAGMGMDPTSAFSASAACLANVGPGFGTVGPTQSYAEVPAAGKVLLTLLMIVGRLELYTVLVLPLLIKRTWRRPRKKQVPEVWRWTHKQEKPREPEPPPKRTMSGRFVGFESKRLRRAPDPQEPEKSEAAKEPEKSEDAKEPEKSEDAKEPDSS